VVGASGTGLQAVTTHIHNHAGGISHAIGTGGRDLKTEVGAITAHQALDLLARDPETKVIVLVSKPPSLAVATKLLSAAQSTRKPVVVDFIGFPFSTRNVDNLQFAISLSEAAQIAANLASEYIDDEGFDYQSPIAHRYVRGLFSGGTLAYEATLGLQTVLLPLYSNTPITESQKLPDPFHSQAHTIIDLGDDTFMVGRLHPMIDNDLRIRRLRQEADDPETGLIVLDVVLGEGSHPDPASEFVPVIQEIKSQHPELVVVVIVLGTSDDPQNYTAQCNRLRGAGAVIFPHVDAAIDFIAREMRQPPAIEAAPVLLHSLTQPVTAINVGLESFYESLTSQGAQAVHVEWRPPASGNERLASLLAKMKT
jgi:FdrA protein